MTRRKSLLAAIAVVGAIQLAGARAASAQIPTVNPDGTLSDPAAPPPSATPAPAQPSEPTIITIGPDGKPIAPAEVEDPSQFTYQDDYVGPDDNRPTLASGPVPSSHVVRRGDTLWDICWFYFNNPWEWPRVWSYNPEITNPHWIYPGDLVRLFQGGTGPVAETPVPGEPGQPQTPERGRPERRGWFTLRQLAFVDQDNLKFSGVVAGSTDEKLLLATDDTIYIDYPEGRPPQVGKRYSVYAERKGVKHPESGKKVGSYVNVLGEVEIISVKKNKRARAVITDAVEPIERGQRVGPLQRQFKNVDTVASTTDLQATIVAQLFADELIGARQVVFIDKGTNAGLRTGNRMFVVRRGDAYEQLGGKVSNRGQDDRRYPARAIGEVLVVQAGKQSSVAVVTMSLQEIEIGDRVLMRKGDGANASGDE